jgi:hypothetical protein
MIPAGPTRRRDDEFQRISNVKPVAQVTGFVVSVNFVTISAVVERHRRIVRDGR